MSICQNDTKSKSACEKLTQFANDLKSNVSTPISKSELKKIAHFDRSCSDKHKRAFLYKAALEHEFNLGSYSLMDSLLTKYKSVIYPLQNKKDSSNLATYYLYIGNNAFRLNKLDDSAKSLDQGIKIAESIKDTNSLVNGYVMLSILFDLIGDSNKSLEYVKKSLALEHKNVGFHAYCDYLSGLCYYKLKQYDKAIFHLSKSESTYLKLGDVFSALNSRVGKVIAEQAKMSPVKFNALHSEKELLKILEESEKQSNPYARAEINLLLSKHYLFLKRFSDAESHAKKSHEDALYIGNNETMSHSSEAVLRSLLTAQNPENLTYLEQFIATNKLLYDSRNAQATISLREKYDTQEKENQLLIEKNRNITYRQYIQLSIAGIIILTLLLIGYFNRRSRRKNEEVNRLQKQALQVQMNPHFMFNSLNSINNFIATNNLDDAQDYLTQFAKLMRVALKSSQEESISIEDEVQFLDSYLALENLRNNNFDYSIEVDSSLLSVKIPPLLIQPLLENAIIHGFRKLEHKGKLLLEIKPENYFIKIKVSDNGWGISANLKTDLDHKSFSAEIQKERLKLYSKEYSDINYSTGIEGYLTPGTSVSFKLPYSK